MNEKLDYLLENMGIEDAIDVISGSVVKATLCTAVLVAFYVLGFVDSIIIQTIPYAIVPCIALAYIGKKWYTTLTERLLFGVITGFVFGLLIRAIGAILVVMVDVIGYQNTLLAVIVESAMLVYWLYTDLTSWVKEDTANKARKMKQHAEVTESK